MRTRLDLEMTRRGLAESREGAQRLIMAGKVRVNSRPAAKADLKVAAETLIEVVGASAEYASRGGYKLAAAIDHFAIEVAGRRALDVGASTGGFTDVLLRRGAVSVIALDVGYGQIAEKLRRDERVIVMDRTNIRNVAPADLAYAPDLIVIDTSFISLRLVLPATIAIAAPRAEIIALVKPQFEVGKGKVGKGGIVRDAALRMQAVEGVLTFAREAGLVVAGPVESPIHGAAGNIEYLALMRKGSLEERLPRRPAEYLT
jgi:23S rRNA (cytidine1920-2'-O)/16S rRNA (cytidine1409-2'-O)-methyltransferase